MMDESLRVDAVDVVRAPGFETESISVDGLSSHVNIVHGPNASGKSTVAKAIQWLLWPDEAPERTVLNGDIARDDDQWRVEVDHDQSSYQQNGHDTDGPTVPPADQRDRYHLALHDLLQQDTRNETFAQTIKRETAGGYDLDAAYEDLNFDDSPSTRGKAVVREAEQAIEAVSEARSEVQDLREEEQRLDGLENDLKEARAAKQRVELLEQTIQYAEARDDLQRVESDLGEYPEVLADLDGDEADEVEGINEGIEEWSEKKSDAIDAIEEAEAQLEEAGLPEDGVPDGFIERLRKRLDNLEALEQRQQRNESQLEDAIGKRESALSDIPLDADGEDLPDLDSNAWETITDFVRSAEKLHAARTMQNQVEQWLGEDDDLDRSETTLERGREALENWLESAGETDEDRRLVRLALASAGMLALAVGALGILVDAALFVFVILPLGIAWYGLSAAKTSSTSARETHRNTFEGLQLDPPGGWTENEVRSRLKDIYDQLARHRLASERDQKRETLEADATDLEEHEEELREQREELREQLGASPKTTDVELLAIAKGILRWQEANGTVEGLEGKIENVDGQIDELRNEILDDLEPYGYDVLPDAASATAHIRDLEGRIDTYEEANREIGDAEETIQEAEQKLENLKSTREELYERAELGVGEITQLRELCDQVEEYEELQQERRSAERLVESEEIDLEGEPGFEPDLKEREVADIKEEKREYEEKAEQYEAIHNEITQIRAKINQAKNANDVEDALAEKDRALDALVDQFERDAASMVGYVLAESVKEATEAKNRPEVFEHASEVLARITTGRYRLELDEGNDTFRAYDTVKERGFGLDKLSSATRLQVLLAVRLAFVEAQENDLQFPLVLDETLANTDDGKADVIIDSVIELARDGRQIFYFTAQGDEVARWLDALENGHDVDHTVIDLAEVTDTDSEIEIPDIRDLPSRDGSPPEPGDHDHGSYGEALDIPQFNPREGAGHAHLWYVVEDVDSLHEILERGYERWGELDNILEQTDGHVIIDDTEALEEIRARGRALEEFVEAWQIGRGQRVDRQALQESGAVTDNFIEEVTELAEELNGDAEQLIEHLRAGTVDRFRRGKIEELEEFFNEQDYIEESNSLDMSQIYARMMECLIDQGFSRQEAENQAEWLLDRINRGAQTEEIAE